MKTVSTIVQYLVLIAIAFLCFRGCDFHHLPRLAITSIMPGYLVVITGVSFAFVWVEILKIGVTKPFNCLTCLSGWFSLILAFVCGTTFWPIYLGVGCFAGYLFTIIRMRYL